MSRARTLADRIRRGERVAWPVAAALTAGTLGPRVGMWWRRRQPVVRVAAHVVSFGNLSAGGTGKTPAVIERARAECAAGRRVAVLTRAYGSARTPEPLALSGDAFAPGLHRRFGDEPVLIARKVPGVQVVKDRDRVRGARYAIERLGCDTLILDDGYQYLRLARDENVLLVDAADPFGNGCLVPRGVLREPPEAAARATAITLTHCGHAPDLAGLTAHLRALNTAAPLRLTRHVPDSLWRVRDGEATGLDTLRGREVDAACAIAVPERFFALLEELGARVVGRHAFRDHARFSPPPDTGRMLVVTEKDAVRMANAPGHIHALGITLEDLPA